MAVSDPSLKPIPTAHPLLTVASLILLAVLFFSNVPAEIGLCAGISIAAICEWSRRRRSTAPHRPPKAEAVLKLG